MLTFLSTSIARRSPYFQRICCLRTFRIRWIRTYCLICLVNEITLLLWNNLNCTYIHSPVKIWAILVFTSAAVTVLAGWSLIPSTTSSIDDCSVIAPKHSSSCEDSVLFHELQTINELLQGWLWSMSNDFITYSLLSKVTWYFDWQFRNVKHKHHMLFKGLTAFDSLLDLLVYAYDQMCTEMSQTCIWTSRFSTWM